MGERHTSRAIRRCEYGVESGGKDTRATHLYNGECLVIQQLFLPQVIIQRRPALLPVLSDHIGGGSGGYLLRDLEPFKVMFDERFEDEGAQFETSRACEPVEGHGGGRVSGNKRAKHGLGGV